MKRINQYAFAAMKIKEMLTIDDLLNLYFPRTRRYNNRIPCPIHNGQGFNLGFNKRVFHCFVCGVSGDVIGFAEHAFGIGFKAAVCKLNNDFGLGLLRDRPLTIREKRERNDDIDRIVAERKEREERERIARNAYNKALDKFVCLDRILIESAPSEQNGWTISDKYANALKRRDEAEYNLGTAEGALAVGSN